MVTRWGGKKTKFFHSKVLIRRIANRLQGLEDARGTWWEGEKDIKDIAISYFSQLYQTSNLTNIMEIVECVERHVHDQHNVALTKPASVEEIKMAIQTMNPSKAPEHDGFTGTLFSTFRGRD